MNSKKGEPLDLLKSSSIALNSVHDEIDGLEKMLIEEVARYRTIREQFPGTMNHLDRLIALGLNKNPSVKSELEIRKRIDKAENCLNLSSYYKRNYPSTTFLPTEVLIDICNRYNLIKKPLSDYIMDIPLENVISLENILDLRKEDEAIVYVIGKQDGSERVEIDLSKILSHYVEREYLENLTPEVFRSRYYISRENKSAKGVHIAASAAYFDATCKEAHNMCKEVFAFRECKGGVQVITKWKY